jgi:hypothetical protein
MTTEVIEAVCQCLLAASADSEARVAEPDPVRDVIEEFSRCLQDIIGASHHAPNQVSTEPIYYLINNTISLLADNSM